MKRHGAVHGKETSLGKVSLSCRWNGRTEHFWADKTARVPSVLCADPVTGTPCDEKEVRDAFKDTIRGSIYELYEKRGWEPESE